jgi:hypothetical protein
MFARHPIADIGHLLTSAPVDIDRIARQSGLAPVASPDPATDERSAAERRYRQALAVARRRLTGETTIRAGTDRYLIELINHHARSIMMPRALLLAALGAGADRAGLAETFAVPLDVVERRLNDADVRDGLR